MLRETEVKDAMFARLETIPSVDKFETENNQRLDDLPRVEVDYIIQPPYYDHLSDGSTRIDGELRLVIVSASMRGTEEAERIAGEVVDAFPVHGEVGPCRVHARPQLFGGLIDGTRDEYRVPMSVPFHYFA